VPITVPQSSADTIDHPRPPFPAWLRWAVTLFVTVFVATHASYGNLVNLLWLSDVALLGALFALWRRSRLVASMMLLGVLLLDGAGWTLDFLVGVLTGWHPLAATRYMFDAHVPALVRGLSLFHLWLPALLLWMVRRLGYDRRALAAQTVLTWTILALSYAATTPERNLNWVLGPGHVQSAVPAWLYLLAEMAVLPLAIYLPVQLVLRRWSR
jgi:hypothetical protein